MSYIKDQIEIAHSKGGLVGICVGRIQWNRRIIGYVKHVYASKFKLQIIDEFGQKKNTKAVLYNAVKSLEIGGIYADNLERLNKEKWVKSAAAPKYAIAGKNNMYKKLNELMEARTVCTFFFGTEFSVGQVSRVTQEEFCISNIAFIGTSDGISIYNTASLTKIRFASNFEQRIAFFAGV